MLRIPPIDAGMLYAETPEMPMHTLGVLVLGPTRHSVFGRLQRGLSERLHLLAPFRRRVVSDPLALDDAYWIEDPEFSLDNHLIHAALPAPGGMREVAEYAGDLAGRLLDRSRPLWEMHLLDGLAGGGAALLLKVHHAAMDGAKLVMLMRTLLEPTARMRHVPPPEEPWKPDAEPSLLWFAADTTRALAEKPLHAARSIAEVGTALLRGREGHATSAETLPAEGAEPAHVFEAPPTPFNGALSASRAIAMADVAFADVKAIGTAFGTTVNDVVLAASCGALRSWLEAHGGLPEKALVANVPVAVRGEGTAESETGNRVSMILVHLPVQTADPVERLQAIAAETARAKARHGGSTGGKGKGDVFRQAAELLTSVTVPWVWPHIMSAFAGEGVAERLPLFWNLVISNLPGPREKLYCAGARVLRIYPFGPVQLGNGLNITVLSSGDRLCLGALACKRMVPDVERIAEQFLREIATLRRRAARRRP
jgi:diacylglycerol O-acyltransferase / wax synthase